MCRYPNMKDQFSSFHKNLSMEAAITPIGISMVSKMFDALLLIEIRVMITKLSEEIFGLVRRIVERADEHDR